MNRNEKLRTLQTALQGVSGQLQQMHRERRRNSMPYKEVHGIIDANNCPPELLNLPANTFDMILDKAGMMPLRDCLRQIEQENRNRQHGRETAMSSIDANDSQFDALPVNYAKVSFGTKYLHLKDITIGELRAYYNQSAAAFESGILLLLFDPDMSQYEWYINRTKTKTL